MCSSDLLLAVALLAGAALVALNRDRTPQTPTTVVENRGEDDLPIEFREAIQREREQQKGLEALARREGTVTTIVGLRLHIEKLSLLGEKGTVLISARVSREVSGDRSERVFANPEVNCNLLVNGVRHTIEYSGDANPLAHIGPDDDGLSFMLIPGFAIEPGATVALEWTSTNAKTGTVETLSSNELKASITPPTEN